MWRSVASLILLCAITVFAQSREDSGKIFLVRHAEKVSDATDALLSKRGEQRATCLAQTLRDAHIGAIYVTPVKRTQQTAQPVAKNLGVQPNVIKADDTAALVAKVKHDALAKNVLIVSHSDILPGVFSQLGISGAPAIGRNEYDLLFLVSKSEGKADLTVLHYCPSSTPPAPTSGPEEMRRMR